MLEIESPFLDEVKELLRKRYEAQYRAHFEAERKQLEEELNKARQGAVVSALETRFGAIPADRIAPLQAIANESRLTELLRLAITCPNLDAFVAGLTSGR